MALINITVDTETKVITASVDGKEYANISEISIYKHFDYYEQEEEVSVCMSSSTKGPGDVQERTTVYASDTVRSLIARAFNFTKRR